MMYKQLWNKHLVKISNVYSYLILNYKKKKIAGIYIQCQKKIIWLSGKHLYLSKVEKIMRNLVLDFQILDITRTCFMN